MKDTIAFRVEIPGRDFFVVWIRRAGGVPNGFSKCPLANKVVHDLEIDHQIERRIWWDYFAQRLVPIDRFISRRDLVVKIRLGVPRLVFVFVVARYVAISLKCRFSA